MGRTHAKKLGVAYVDLWAWLLAVFVGGTYAELWAWLLAVFVGVSYAKLWACLMLMRGRGLC